MTGIDLDHLAPADFSRLLAAGRLTLQTGAVTSALTCSMPDVAAYMHRAYRRHPWTVDADFADFRIEVRRPRNLRRWLRPQVEFVLAGAQPFEPLPRDQAPALVEWGLNWAVATSCHQWLVVHAASLERGGAAVILPAPPGSGKSTLCAALALRGWRLLSDELTLLDPEQSTAHALARPVNLKNASIELIRAFDAAAEWGPVAIDTVKGRVTHLCPPADSVARMLEPARPRWIVFPKFVPGAEPLLTPRDKASTFTYFAANALNYGVLGELGFAAVGLLLDRCECFDFVYSRLEDALEVFAWLSDERSTSVEHA